MNNLIILAIMSRAAFHYTETGLAVYEGTLAFTREVADAITGELKKLPSFIPFQVLGRAAEIAAETIKAGQPVLGHGVMNYEEWLSPTGSGVKNSRIRAKLLTMSVVECDLPVFVDKGEQGETLRLDGGFATVMIRGNVTSKPIVKETKGGTAVSIQLAVDEKYRDRQNQAQSRTHFLPATLWRDEGEAFLKQGVGVGQKVLVMGDLVNENWTTEAGEKRSTLRVNGTQFVASPKVERPAVQPQRDQVAQPVRPAQVPAQVAAPSEAPEVDVPPFIPADAAPFEQPDIPF